MQPVTACFAVDHLEGEDHTIARPAEYEAWQARRSDVFPDGQLSLLAPDPRTNAPVLRRFAPNPPGVRTCNVHEVQPDEMILDVGPAAVEADADVLKTCRTLVWNGPLGAFETPPFDRATVALAKTAAALTKEGSPASVAGGGDTVAALNHAGVAGDFTFVSTAGGAFLEWMEGRTLPGVAALERQ